MWRKVAPSLLGVMGERASLAGWRVFSFRSMLFIKSKTRLTLFADGESWIERMPDDQMMSVGWWMAGVSGFPFRLLGRVRFPAFRWH